jgi:hypothetical protein
VYPALLVAGLAASACQREQVTHFTVPKGAEPAPRAVGPMGGMPGNPMMPPGGGMPPGMAGDVAAPPTPGAKLAWALPKGWSDKREGGMRYATFKPPVQGRIDASVVVLPGPAGGELQNVNRWRNQIGLGPIDDDALGKARTAVKSKAGTLSVYDFTSEGEKRSRVVAGLFEAGGSTWFVKLTGDAEAVASARPDFMRLMESLRLE